MMASKSMMFMMFFMKHSRFGQDKKRRRSSVKNQIMHPVSTMKNGSVNLGMSSSTLVSELLPLALTILEHQALSVN